MSTTHNYLTKRLVALRLTRASTESEIARLQKKHADQTSELAEIEAALAAMDALVEPEPDDDEIAEARRTAALGETEEEKTDRD